MKYLYGTPVAEELISKAIKLARGNKLQLAVITIGEDPASEIYIRNKKITAEKCGFEILRVKLKNSVKQHELNDIIWGLSFNHAVHGIILQLPIPEILRVDSAMMHLNYYKDADGFTIDHIVDPCTPAGIIDLLNHYDIPIEGKNVTILGRSRIVGLPMARMMMKKNATVTVCHSHTEDISMYTKNADIVVSAVGKAKLLTGNMVKDGSVIIDVGMNRDENGKLCGDCDISTFTEKDVRITPVPGGVGPITCAKLMHNMATLYAISQGLRSV